ncbi:MAG: ThiF family adenylyltransferase, partial [Acidobacteria bacterium]|nr:ThiF family adenylyltransferase [Acidobacteriota bacterium]
MIPRRGTYPSSRYQRQIALPPMGELGQKRLREARVTLIGMGALGCVQAAYLARSGVGLLRLVDRDVVEEGNLQRQLLFDESDALEGAPKAEAARRHLQSANSEIVLESRVRHLEPGNARELLSGSDVILDGTDNFETRFLINDYSIATGTPWVYGACVGTVGIAAPLIPGRSACLRCLLSPESSTPEPTCESAGILGPVAGIIGSLQAAAALRILVERAVWDPWGPIRVEAWDGMPTVLPRSKPDPRCPACAERKLEFLEGRRSAAQEVLCGREAVQVLPYSRAPRDLCEAERILSRHGEVRRTPYLLRATLQGHHFSIFPDGRVIVFGTSDP